MEPYLGIYKWLNTAERCTTPSRTFGQRLNIYSGLKHDNIPIQLDFWDNEVVPRGNEQTTPHGYPRPEA